MSVGFAQRSEVLLDDEDHADTTATTTTTTTTFKRKRKRSTDYLRYIVTRPRIRRKAPSLSFFSLFTRRIRTTNQTDSFRELSATDDPTTSIPRRMSESMPASST